MHSVSMSRPAPQLRGLVRFYSQRNVSLDGGVVVHPVVARATPLLEFNFGGRFQVFRSAQSRFDTSPNTVVVGPQTNCDAQLHLSGAFESFVIMFQPAGLHRLFSLSMEEISDRDFEGQAVLGPQIHQLEQRLGSTRTFAARVRLVDEFLSHRALQLDSFDSISAAAHRILTAGGAIRIPTLAADAGLSVRQFERAFLERVGVRPKLFARIARFEAALDSKARSVAKSWTHIAHEFGYYDQMHLIHDFADFAGETPSRTLACLEALFRGRIEAMRSQSPAPSSGHEHRLIL